MLLVNDMSEDLSRMFRLFSRVPDGLAPIADILKQHIAEVNVNDRTNVCVFCHNTVCVR